MHHDRILSLTVSGIAGILRPMDRKKVIGLTAMAAILTLSPPAVRAAPPTFDYKAGTGAVVLKGPWERYEGLLPEEALDSGKVAAPSTIVELNLRERAPDASILSEQDAATYRTKVRLEGKAPNRRMALYIPAIAGVRTAYVNGLRLYDSGCDSQDPPLLLFDAPTEELSIILQVKQGIRGFEAPSFIPPFILLGDAEPVSRARLGINISVAALDGFFGIIGLFVFILFLFWKKNIDFLAFSVYMLSLGVYYLLANGTIVFHLAAESGRLEIAHLVALDLQYLAFAFFIHMLYRDRAKFPAALALYAVPGLHAAAVLAFPSIIGPLYLISRAYFALFVLAVLALSTLLAIKGDPKARWLIPAFAVMLASFAFRRFGPETIWNAYLVEPAGMALFGVIAMLMLIKKVAATFESTEELTDYVASVSRTVKRFIPKEFLEHLQKDDLIDLRLGDHAKKAMTIFFSDIRGFTELSEKLTVEENFAFINSYLARVVPIIKENNGFVDKYVGDGIMALFPGPQGPDEAIRSAIAMQTKMVEYNGHRAKVGYRPISMGVGVHTGDLMLGVVGVDDRMENTVISDAVNLSSRLQSITKAFNIGLAISEQAFKELEDPGSYMYRFIGKVKVRGKAAPVSVFDIFDGIEPNLFERKMKSNMFFEQGMLAYYQKDFSGAMSYFKHVIEILPEDGAAKFYLENCMNKVEI